MRNDWGSECWGIYTGKGSETLVYKIQTPGNYPEESIQHSEHGESLKSRIQEYNVTLRRFRATIVTVENQEALDILSV
jgi:hypothetical protein